MGSLYGTSNLSEPLVGQLDIVLVGLLTLLLKGMKYIDGIGEFYDIEYSPLAKRMYADFLYARAYRLHSFPVSWFKPVLDCSKFKTCDTASFLGKSRRSSRLDPTNLNAFVLKEYYISFDIFCKFIYHLSL